jgi:Fe-S oxidoreductase
LINTKIASDLAKLPQISTFAVELLGEYGGAWSSEHGDGRARSWLSEKFYGKALYGLYQEVKQTFDPHNILNPGNIVNVPPQTQTNHLRFGAAYTVIPFKEQLDFSSDQGFHRAVEMCNGAGVCRKITTGAMCPSFMVTREEEHSTRGRANALRAALSGTLPAEEFTSKRMYEVMDLCVSCKACKTECPSAVDMSKIKFEFLAHYYEKHGVPRRAKLFGDIHFLSRLSSGFPAPLVNWLSHNLLVRWGLERFMGISRQRTLPEFAAEPFTRWFNRPQKPPPATGEQPQVVLFNDTFHTYNYPHVAIAATEVLEAAGFEVILPGHNCCGRPMMSKGLVKQARRAAQDTLEHLAPFAQQGLPIVGLEPSCLLSMRDEYAALLPHDKRVELVAAHCYTFEEFMAKLAKEGKLALKFKDETREVLLHGHCHQKALTGTGPSQQTLALPGYAVREVDSSCCGMAGSFGYEAEHYDISLKMGERRLFPTVREQGEAVIIAAAGVSCRQQIKHGTGRQALHPAEVLRQALKQP